MKKMRLALLFAFAFAVVAAGCATEPAPLDRTQPEALNKAMFTGDWLYMTTTTDTDYANRFSFVGEQEDDFNYGATPYKIRWEINQNKLNVYAVPIRYLKPDGTLVENMISPKSPVLSFPITKHYDIRFQYNPTTREDLNVIVENYDRPWYLRQYMEVDWSQNTVENFERPMEMDLITGKITKVPVAVYENAEFFTHKKNDDGTIDKNAENDLKIDTRKWDPKKDPEVYAINIDLKEAITTPIDSWWEVYIGAYNAPTTVKTRHSFMKSVPADQNDYLPFHFQWKEVPQADGSVKKMKVCECPKEEDGSENKYCKDNPDYNHCSYNDTFWRRFPLWRNQADVWDPERGTLLNQNPYLVNRWDFTNGKKLNWYASPFFQEQINEGDTDLMQWAVDVVEYWNRPVREALGVDINDTAFGPMFFKQNEPMLGPDGKQITNLDGSLRWKYELGDYRYSMINFIHNRPSEMGLLGYGPAKADPDTGEYKHGLVNVYGDAMDWDIRRMLDLFDWASGRCTTEQVTNGNFWDPVKCNCNSNQFQGQYKGGVLTGIPDDAHCFDKTALNNVADTGANAEQKRMHTLSPALMTAYYNKGDIHSPKNNLPRKQYPNRDALIKLRRDAELKSATSLNLSGVSALKGTPYEQMLVPHSTYKSALPGATGADDPNVIGVLSPANRLAPDFITRLENNAKANKTCRLEAGAFDPALIDFVKEAVANKYSRQDVYKIMRKWDWYATTLHEMGHTMGFIHNFKASSDRRNFSAAFEAPYKAYWDQIYELRKKYQSKIDEGDADAYMAYVEEADKLGSPHNRYAGSSIMDYMGWWEKWQMPVGSFDRGGILFSYGDKVETIEGTDKLDFDGVSGAYGQLPWKLASYKPGDFDQKGVTDSRQIDWFSTTTKNETDRFIRYFLTCTDMERFDDGFCTPFDQGVNATEIVRNFIRDYETRYFIRNFKRNRNDFDDVREGYYFSRWLNVYYTYAKSLAQLQINQMWYEEAWGAAIDATAAISNGPESMNMIPGYMRTGSEDLLRASLLFYYYMLYDMLGRPDYGYAKMSMNNDLKPYFEGTDLQYISGSDVSLQVMPGTGLGWGDHWDKQDDIYQLDVHLNRIGVELDKVINLEILSIPAALNDVLRYEKANGLNYWNTLWNGAGVQAWQVIGGMITDTFTHRQTAWCVRCDADCQANTFLNPPKVVAYPVDLMEGLKLSGDYQLFNGYNACMVDGDCASPEVCNDGICKPNINAMRCGKDEYPLMPGMDALFAIYPIFYGIVGASHPWYTNDLADYFDSMVVGGNHRFDIPQAKYDAGLVAEFVNGSGTKTYRAVQTDDGLGISYKLAKQGIRIKAQGQAVDYCKQNLWSGPIPANLLAKLPQVDPGRVCDDVYSCFFYQQTPPDYCVPEGWDSTYLLDFVRTRYIDRIESILIMMQDMIDIGGHQQWRVPSFLEEP
jgi:hypothetical protein